MKFGKLFTKLIAIYPEFATLSANKCSELTYTELRIISHKLYSTQKELLHNYFLKPKEELAKTVYQALCKL
jgi:hypothetical protein